MPSAPLHVVLYQYFGWEPPVFAHLPLLLKPDGNGKLSKRDAEKHGFPIFPLQWSEGDKEVQGFKESGYYPEALLNFIALLGWNPGGEEEIFSLDELIEAFSLEKVHKSGAKFDINKARWFNEHYLQSRDEHEIALRLVSAAIEKKFVLEIDRAKEIVALLKQRVTFESDLLANANFYFNDPVSYDEELVSKKWTAEAVEVLESFTSELESLEKGSEEDYKSVLVNVLENKDVKMGKVMPALRIAITGEVTGPDLMGMIKVLGGQVTSHRIKIAIEKLSAKVIA